MVSALKASSVKECKFVSLNHYQLSITLPSTLLCFMQIPIIYSINFFPIKLQQRNLMVNFITGLAFKTKRVIYPVFFIEYA